MRRRARKVGKVTHYSKIYAQEGGSMHLCICITSRKSASGSSLFGALQALNRECGGGVIHRKAYNADDHQILVQSKFGGALGEGRKYL